MNKNEVKQRVLKNGKPLSKKLFSWCEETRTFSSKEDNLVIDFGRLSNCTFKTEWECTFKTGPDCTFNTGSCCTFDTGSRCTFNTFWQCTFKTSSGCIFKAGSGSTFDTGSDCTFNTGSDCTFDTGSDCTFNTGYGCTFDTYYNCVVIRRDVYEVIELKHNQEIKLNECGIKGYKIINPARKITFDDQEIELSEESYQSFKKQFAEE